jgi:hypothetical protein
MGELYAMWIVSVKTPGPIPHFAKSLQMTPDLEHFSLRILNFMVVQKQPNTTTVVHFRCRIPYIYKTGQHSGMK